MIPYDGRPTSILQPSDAHTDTMPGIMPAVASCLVIGLDGGGRILSGEPGLIAF